MEYVHGAEPLLPRVSAVEVLPSYRLLLEFRNGEKRVFDMSSFLSMPAYKSLERNFSAAHVAFGTIVWPGDIDISPETLYMKSLPV